MTLKWQKLRIGKIVPLSERNKRNPLYKVAASLAQFYLS